MIQIVLDSNIIRSNWYLSGANMTVIEKLIKLNVCKLVVPDIVVLEVNNLFRKEVNKAIREVNSLKTILTELSLSVSCPDTEEICGKYRDRLNERLDNLKVQRLTYSSIPQDKIVARAISSRRPFQEGGKGYKDAIIWENILSVAGSDDETFVITNDLNDFSDKSKDKQLHPDLVKDLEDMVWYN